MILFCKCSDSDQVDSSKVIAISVFLENANLEYLEISNLCGEFESDQSSLTKIINYPNASIRGVSTSIWKNREPKLDPLVELKDDSFVVIACYPRTIIGLLNRSNISTAHITIFNLREDSVENIISNIEDFKLPKKTQSSDSIAKSLEVGEGSSGGWFPIIDNDRCTNCGQCMDFCLFGVYERMDDKSIKVLKPENCKENCPACARICPQIAIIFPKLPEKPINGSEVNEGEHKNLKLDINDMFGDDVYTALAARKKRSKKNLLKSQNIIEAENERDKCVMQLLDQDGNKANSICSCNCSKKD